MKHIVIKGAREHNLKNISLSLPRDKLIVITGLSGSGKSTLAFDTLYAEGQRRYVESLSAYARQFLGLMHKPDVDSIEGLSPAIAIEQKTTSKNPRSTVGTVTEIYDYLRLLYARIGIPHCPEHDVAISAQSPDEIVRRILEEFSGSITIYAPVIRQKKGTYEKLLQDLFKEGYTKARVNGNLVRTDEKITLERYKKHDIDVVIDRISLPASIPLTEQKPEQNEKINTQKINTHAGKNNAPSSQIAAVNPADKQQTNQQYSSSQRSAAQLSNRLSEAVTKAIEKSEGLVVVADHEKEKMFSSAMACTICGYSIGELQPRMFSFNSPFGACQSCHGIGYTMEFDPDLIIPDKTKSIADGAVAIYRNVVDGWRVQYLAAVAKHFGFSVLTPIKDLTKEQLNVLLYGSDERIHFFMNMK
ncbi:MAG: excinuclease ABC subunit UvrA, partial [Candidatus Woesearchaeota archaeon]